MPRYLIAADPAQSLNPKSDTTLRLAHEALKVGIQVDFLDLNEHDYRQPSETYLGRMPVRKVIECDPRNTEFIKLGELTLAKVSDYDVVLNRKDPPVDESYRGQAAHFAQAPKQILQINDPTSATRFFEKELVQRYPQFSVPTRYCESFEDALEAVREVDSDEAVMKPSNLFSGIGIGFFKKNASESELKAHWEKWKPCFVQPYLPEITRSGDLRILVVNQRVIGSVLRVPAPGSRLGNLKQGASAAFFEPTAHQLRACAHIAADLAPFGLHFLGLDFIGEFLTEVNMTCPTAVPQAEEVMREPVGARLIEEIEKLRLKQIAPA